MGILINQLACRFCRRSAQSVGRSFVWLGLKAPGMERMQLVRERIRKHLERELSGMREVDRSKVEEDLVATAERFERYSSSSKEWKDYAARARRFDLVSSSAQETAKVLREFDMVSREDLEIRLGRARLASIIFDLDLLFSEINRLAKDVQRKGAPRNLAEERWMCEIADIFENVFGGEAKVWGSGSTKGKSRGPFYRLLEVCRPASFPPYGKLHPKQVATVLRRRTNKRRTILTL